MGPQLSQVPDGLDGLDSVLFEEPLDSEFRDLIGGDEATIGQIYDVYDGVEGMQLKDKGKGRDRTREHHEKQRLERDERVRRNAEEQRRLSIERHKSTPPRGV